MITCGVWKPVSSSQPTRGGFIYVRVDDRLIHGQVVIGWGLALNLNCLVLANDRVAVNPDESKFYCHIIPEEMGAVVETVAESARGCEKRRQAGLKCLMVVSSIEDLSHWFDSGGRPDRLILGGIRSSANRRRLLDYLYLSEEEIKTLLTITEKGIPVVCQDLPTSPPIPLLDALKRAS